MPKHSTTDSRILIITSTFPRWRNDAVTHFVFDLAKHLKTDKTPIVLAPHHPGSHKKERMDGILVYRFQYWPRQNGQNVVYNGGGVPNFKKTPLHFLKLAGYAASMFVQTIRIAKKENVDIINPHWLVPQGYLAMFANYFIRSKVVITIHGGGVFLFNGRLFRTIKRWTLKRADEVVVNSSAVLEAARSLYDGREYSVIPMGVDTKHFCPDDTDNTDNQTFNVLFVGRLSEEKGVLYACQAIRTMIDDGRTDIFFRVVGDGPKREQIKQYIETSNLREYAELIGWVEPSNLPDYYREADVLVGPSIVSSRGAQEAFGLVFAESLATGTPVVATRIGGIKDIVIDGENGFLVPEKDANAIADALKLLSSDKALLGKLQNNARDRVVAHFSWDSAMEGYAEMFDFQGCDT